MSSNYRKPKNNKIINNPKSPNINTIQKTSILYYNKIKSLPPYQLQILNHNTILILILTTKFFTYLFIIFQTFKHIIFNNFSNPFHYILYSNTLFTFNLTYTLPL